MTHSPTIKSSTYLDNAHAFFNKRLFGGKLPQAMIHLHRHARSYGYFSGERFEPAYEGNQPAATDEIALNPSHVAERPAKKVLSTLVHEMCHQWQHWHGKRPTRCYHDRQWAAQMKEVGLYPSSTGAPGGKEVGPQVSHYIIDGGLFDKVCDEFMLANETTLYQDVNAIRSGLGRGKAGGDDDEGKGKKGGKAKSKGRVKFTCPGCELNAWAKPSARLECMECEKQLEPADDEAKKEGDDD